MSSFLLKRKTVFAILLILILTVCSSCASIGFGTTMPTLNMYSEVENDEWLLIDNTLINKQHGRVHHLKVDTDATIPGIAAISYYSPYTYKVEFEENNFRLYTFLQTYYYPEGSKDAEYAFFDCMFTYNYEGQEIDRTYLSESMTEQQALALYDSRVRKDEAFAYTVNALWKFEKDDDKSNSAAKQAILEYVEPLYDRLQINISAVTGSAKAIGDDVWFSVVIAPNGHFNSGNPLLDDIKSSVIKSYDPSSGEFGDVFQYNKRNETIVDFDEKGLYTFDADGKLKYFDRASKKSTLIHKFSGTVYSFDVTDHYIGVGYEDGNIGYYYSVYEKGKDIIADSLTSEYNRYFPAE